MQSSTISFYFNESHAKRLLKLLIIAEICMVLFFLLDHYLLMFLRPHEVFDLDGEESLSAWFSSIQLFMIGLLFLSHNFKSQNSMKIPLGFLTFIGIGFIFLSIDEAVMIHEKMNGQLSNVNWLPKFKGGNGIWISIYATLLMVILLTFKTAIFNCWKYYRKEFLLFVCGSLIIGVGAVLLEITDYEYFKYNASQNGHLIEIAFEEGLEMIGASLILYATILFNLNTSK